MKQMHFKVIEQHKDTDLIVLDNDLPIRYFGGEVLINNSKAIAKRAPGWSNGLYIEEKGNYTGKELIIHY
ncbi:MAG: hypothetical protein K5979_02160 [Ruminococcus sp.]|nr:hypothetical protein [Ruminococcus sp.]